MADKKVKQVMFSDTTFGFLFIMASVIAIITFYSEIIAFAGLNLGWLLIAFASVTLLNIMDMKVDVEVEK